MLLKTYLAGDRFLDVVSAPMSPCLCLVWVHLSAFPCRGAWCGWHAVRGAPRRLGLSLRVGSAATFSVLGAFAKVARS